MSARIDTDTEKHNMADHVIGFFTRGISKSIAVGSEALAGQKGRSSAEARRSSLDNESDEEDITEQIWKLDDAAEEPGLHNEKSAAARCQHCGLEHNTTNNISRMEQSVIIPQKRPGTRTRGYVRAYAPILGTSKGIDQDTFLGVLSDLDKSSKSSPVFDVINIACFAAGLVPSEIAAAVTTVVAIVNKTAQEIQVRYQTNKCLDEMNQKLFQPHGCYAMIMTYKPDMADEPLLEVNTVDLALSRSLNADTHTKQMLRRLRPSSGKTTESQLPEFAPLIYPSLDLVLISTDLRKQSSPKERARAVNEYLDQRAQTEFQSQNPQSKLSHVAPPQGKQYVNRFADPNHPVNSGSIFGLLSGGTFDPIASGRVRRAERHTKQHGQPTLTDQERHDAYMGRKVRGRITGTPSKKIPIIGKMMKKDILYLVIVDVPTKEQLASVRQQFELPNE